MCSKGHSLIFFYGCALRVDAEYLTNHFARAERGARIHWLAHSVAVQEHAVRVKEPDQDQARGGLGGTVFMARVRARVRALIHCETISLTFH
jgi:hypothetical protein